MNYKKLSKKSMILPTKQKMLVLHAIETLNSSLQTIGESPVRKKQLQETSNL
jgi:hypothetical protein